MRQLLSAMLAVFALAVPAAAQEGLPDPAMLVADDVSHGSGWLKASAQAKVR